MLRTVLSLLFLMLIVGCTPRPAIAEYVVIQTSVGDIKLELYEDKAPLSVQNFLQYAEEGFYEGTVFHRVIKGFMIQGGGFDTNLKKKTNRAPIKNEADNGLKNERGTIAMARTSVVDSATSQFFINLVANDFLNHKNKTPRGYGYAVFGKVVEGMEIVDKIGATPTRRRDGLFQNLPVESVIIESVKRFEQ